MHVTEVLAILISAFALLISFGSVFLPFYRRPSLSLHKDSDREHSHVEGNGIPYLRALVANRNGRRSAKHARVVVDGYRAVGASQWTRVGSPFLAWPSVFGQDSDSYVEVIFAGAERPVGIGRFLRVKADDDGRLVRVGMLGGMPVFHDAADSDARWYLHLSFAGDWSITDERDWLDPGEWTIRLLVGADDGDAHAYVLKVAWRGDEKDADEILAVALDQLDVLRD